MPYSVTNVRGGLRAAARRRRVLDLDAPLTTVLAELTARTTMREVLAHRSGLVVLDEDAPEEVFYDWDRMCTLLAKQPPAWEPGTARGESALFYGHLVGEVVRRTDGRSLGRFLADEVCEPLSLDFQVGVAEQDLGRVADLTGFDEEFRRAGVEGRSDLYVRALTNPPGRPRPGRAERDRVAHRRGAGGERARHRPRGGRPVRRARAGPAAHRGPAGTGDRARRDRAGPGPRRRARLGLGVAVDPDGYGDGRDRRVSGGGATGRYAIAFFTGHIGDHDRGDRIENAPRCPGAAAGVIARPAYPRQAPCVPGPPVRQPRPGRRTAH